MRQLVVVGTERVTGQWLYITMIQYNDDYGEMTTVMVRVMTMAMVMAMAMVMVMAMVMMMVVIIIILTW